MKGYNSETAQKLLEAKMLLDTFSIPKRPISLSSYQYKKKFGSNRGYAEYKQQIAEERREWDNLYKQAQKNLKMKNRYLAEINLSDEAIQQARSEAAENGLSIPEILSAWLEKGRNYQE